MARDQIASSGDSIGLYVTIQNNNAVKDDALQTATGITEGVSNIGAVPVTLPSGAPNASDTLLQLAYKAYDEASGSIDTDDVRHSGANSARDRELGTNGQDYDYKAATTAVLGTTEVTSSGQATALGYPSAGIWHVASTYSDGLGGSAGRVRTVWLSDGEKMYVTLWNDVAWTTPTDVLKAPYRADYDAGGDWGAASGGTYTITLSAATHGLGADVSAEVWDTSSVSGSRIPFFGYRVEASTGNVVITASETPDERVALRVVVRAH